MPYPYLNSLIDSYIEQLYQVRELLLASQSAAAPTARPRREKKQSMLQTIAPAPVEQLTSNDPAEAQPETATKAAMAPAGELTPRRLPPAMRRDRSRSRRQSQSRPNSALGGTVPTGPVFVSAHKVRTEQNGKDAANSAPGSPAAQESNPLTVESLTRSWLHSASS